MRGATTGYDYPGNYSNCISIHTPHAGSDRNGCHHSPMLCRFQSTLPMRGATRPVRMLLCGDYYFNPHSPCGERRNYFNGENGLERISIHTPHAGSDPKPSAIKPPICLFQSTLPMRGATSLHNFCIPLFEISIHTPHAGSDWFG